LQKITPKDIFDKLVEKACLYGLRKRPGAMIEALSENERKILRELKSEDVKNDRAVVA
jgi:hypothetical protein